MEAKRNRICKECGRRTQCLWEERTPTGVGQCDDFEELEAEADGLGGFGVVEVEEVRA